MLFQPSVGQNKFRPTSRNDRGFYRGHFGAASMRRLPGRLRAGW